MDTHEQILKEIRNLSKKIDSQFTNVQDKFLSLIQGGIGRILASQQKELVFDEIDELPCNLGLDIRTECLNQKKSRFKPFLEKIEAGSWRDAYEELEIYEVQQATSPGDQLLQTNSQCKNCAVKIQKQVKPVKELLRSLLGFFHGSDIPSVQQLQFTLEPKVFYEQVINPISNSTRLAILLHIFRGHKRFSELKQIMQTGSSVLDHHLTKLIGFKFVAKDSDNNYTVTVLGEEVLKSLTFLSTKITENLQR